MKCPSCSSDALITSVVLHKQRSGECGNCGNSFTVDADGKVIRSRYPIESKRELACGLLSAALVHVKRTDQSANYPSC